MVEQINVTVKGFQSTPPVRGATLLHAINIYLLKIFQSTPPVRGATWL